MTAHEPRVRRPHLERRAAERRRRTFMIGAVAAVVASVGPAALLFGSDPGDPITASGGASAEARPAATVDGASALTSESQPSTIPPPTTEPPTTAPTTTPPDDALPPSGEGRRVGFSIERQRL